jgi:hypothetical protein
MKTFQAGDRVRFSSTWLRSIGACTGPVPQLRGTVVKVRSFSNCLALVTVDWDQHYFDSKATSVLASNLERSR